MYAFRTVSAEDAPAYQCFTYPAYRALLDHAEGARVLATGASLLGNPVGLALASLRPLDRAAELRSIAVDAAHRRRRIAATLLERLEAELSARSYGRIDAGYTVEEGADQHYRHAFFASTGWQTPAFSGYICVTDRAHVSRAGWLNRAYTLPRSMEITRWVDLGDNVRDEARGRLRDDLCCPDDLSPFRYENLLEPANSLALLQNGRVAGWMITHRIDPHTIRYTNLYVRPDLQRTGIAMKLMIEAIRRHALTDLGYSVPMGIWMWAAGNFQVRFLEHHMRPYLTKLSRTYRTSKTIGAHD